MAGKTKKELQAEIEAIKGQLAIKNDYIETLEYLLESADRDMQAVRPAYEGLLGNYVKTQKGRIRSQLKRMQQQKYLFERFKYYMDELHWTNPVDALDEANEDVELHPEYKKGYGKSSLYEFRGHPEISAYFSK